MKFVIISPPYMPGDLIIVPYGMSIVKAFLQQNHHTRQVDLNMRIRDSKRKVQLERFMDYKVIQDYLNGHSGNNEKQIRYMLDEVKLNKDEVVLLSCHFHHQFLLGLMLAKHLKEKNGNKIVMGGAYFYHANIDDLHKRFKFVDIFSVGSIECVYDKMTYFLRMNKRGVINKKNSIPKLLQPDYKDIQLKDYVKKIDNKQILELPVQTGLKCQNSCRFCNFFRLDYNFPVKEIVESIRIQQKKYGTDYFYFVNNSITNNTQQLFSELINGNVKIKWRSRICPDELDPQTIKLLKMSGCYQLEMGIESGSDSVRDDMNKKIELKKLLESLEICKRYGIRTGVYMIIGFPTETNKDFMMTLDLIKKISGYVSFFQLAKFFVSEGSEISRNPEKYNISLVESPESSVPDVIKGYRTFIYHKPNNADKRLKKAWSVVYKHNMQKRYGILRIIPFDMFYYLFHKKMVFRKSQLNSLFNIYCYLFNQKHIMHR